MEKKQDTSISIDYDQHVESIEDRIEIVKLRQQEIQSLLTTISGANQNLEVLLLKEKDAREKGKFYSLISKNTQLLAELHTTYAQYEAIINKYVQDIGKTVQVKHRLIHIDLRQLDEKLNNTSNDVTSLIYDLRKLLTDASNEKLSKKKKIKLDKEEYSMD